MTSERPGSRLPDDPRYWENLAARSVEAAFGGAHARPESAAAYPWWRGLSESAFALAASAVLALAGGSLLIGVRSPRADQEPGAFAGALAPDDPLLRTLLDAPDEPASGAALLELLALREEER
ncbi:MAG TPA: hypothetical protein VFZ24_08985 [Longimicrobiales bacterium]